MGDGVIGFVLGVVVTVGFVASYDPVSRNSTIAHGCATYVCDEGSGDCVFTWLDETTREWGSKRDD